MAQRNRVRMRSGLDTINGSNVSRSAIQRESEGKCMVFETERWISRNKRYQPILICNAREYLGYACLGPAEAKCFCRYSKSQRVPQIQLDGLSSIEADIAVMPA